MNQQSGAWTAILKRGVVGAFSGAILGSAITLLYSSRAEPELASGITIGIGLGTVLSVALGAVELKGAVKHITIAVLVGLFVGTIAGGLIYPEIIASRNLDTKGGASRKALASYQRKGLRVGVPLGGMLGMLVGSCYSLCRDRSPKSPPTEPDLARSEPHPS